MSREHRPRAIRSITDRNVSRIETTEDKNTRREAPSRSTKATYQIPIGDYRDRLSVRTFDVTQGPYYYGR